MDLHQIREDNHVLKLARNPNQIQRILIHANLVRQHRRIITAKPCPAIWVNTDTEVAHSSFQGGAADDVGYCGVHAEVGLRC